MNVFISFENSATIKYARNSCSKKIQITKKQRKNNQRDEIATCFSLYLYENIKQQILRGK